VLHAYRGKKSCNRTLNGKNGRRKSANKNKTQHSTAQMIRNTKKKSNSRFNGMTALYKFTGILSDGSSYYVLGHDTMLYCRSVPKFLENMLLPSSGLKSVRWGIMLYNQVAWTVFSQTHGRSEVWAWSEPKGTVNMKNVVFWDVTPCGSCKSRRFGGT
jgi:hypothetical protein